MRTRVCDMFDLELPLFAFSKAPAVVAAVSKAGGMGVLGAIAYEPEELERHLKWIDEHVDGKPYGVDVVMPAKYQGSEQGGLEKGVLEQMLPAAHRAWVEELLERYQVPKLPPGENAYESLLGWTHARTRPQVDVALEHPIKLLANALGPPPADVIEKAHQRGVKVAALTGSVQHARKQVEAGVDIVIAQGSEAGGHTGDVSTMVLVPEIVDAISPVPVLAAGGIGCGRQIAAAVALGADGAWTGSVWLTTKETDVHPAVVEKLLRAGSRDTVRTRSWTGKHARFLKSAWTEEWDGPKSPGPLPMPLQFMLNADATTRIHRFADAEGSRARELLTSPVGQIVGRMNEQRSVADVIRDMKAELEQSVRRLDAAFRKDGKR